MFGLVSGLYMEYFSPEQLNLLIVGGQGVGKTAFLERLKVTDFSTSSSSLQQQHQEPTTSSSTNNSRRSFRRKRSSQYNNQQQHQQHSSRLIKNSQYIFFDDGTITTTTNSNGTNRPMDGNQNNTVNDINVSDNNNNNNNDNSKNVEGDDIDNDMDDEDESVTCNDEYYGDISSDDNILDDGNEYSHRQPRRATRKFLKIRTKSGAVGGVRTLSPSRNTSGRNNINGSNTLISGTCSGMNNISTGTGGTGTTVSGSNTTVAANTNTTNDDNNNNTKTSGVDKNAVSGSTSSAITTSSSSLYWYMIAKLCPAPRKYKKHDDNESDEEEYYVPQNNKVDTHSLDHVIDGEHNPLLSQNEHDEMMIHANTTTTTSSSQMMNDDDSYSSMESIDFEPIGNTNIANTNVRRGERRSLYKKDSNNTNNNTSYDDNTDSKDNNRLNKKKDQQQHLQTNVEYDLKHNCKMLPLTKIKRTIGMNLTKVHIYQAVVHAWDLGGKLTNLWNRYYSDADAVIFVWKINIQDLDNIQQDDDDSDAPPKLTAADQTKLLKQVRSSIPDDIPFMILCHIFDPITEIQQHSILSSKNNKNENNATFARYRKILKYCRFNRRYPTSLLVPQQHQHPTADNSNTTTTLNHHQLHKDGQNTNNDDNMNNCQGLFFINASNGQGIKSSVEWLITNAKRRKQLLKTTDSIGVGSTIT